MRVIRQVLALVAVGLLATVTACGTITNPAIGTWGTGQSGEPQLKLTHEGVVSGTDGCNTIKGTWAEEGDTVTFYNFYTTKMACPDVDVWLTNPPAPPSRATLCTCSTPRDPSWAHWNAPDPHCQRAAAAHERLPSA